MAKRRKPRSAAQKEATRKMIAANRAARRGGKKSGRKKDHKRAGSKKGGSHLAKANTHLAKAVLEMNLHHAAQRVGHQGGLATARKRRAKRK